MPQSFSISTEPGKMVVRLSPVVNPIVALGFFVSGLLFLILGSLYLYLLSTAPGFYFLIPLAIAFIYSLVGVNMIKKMTYYEVLEITSADLSITRRFSIGSHTDTYPLSSVSNICFVGREDFTPHPFEGKHFDIGFGAMEKEIQYLISDGNILLIADDKSRRFGRHVPSWDAEEIIGQIENYTGKTFTPMMETVNIDEDEWMNEAS